MLLRYNARQRVAVTAAWKLLMGPLTTVSAAICEAASGHKLVVKCRDGNMGNGRRER